MDDLLINNADSDFTFLALRNPTFISEFGKVLDHSQAEIFNQFVESENAKHDPSHGNVSQPGLEEIDEMNQKIKSLLEPTRMVFDILMKFQDITKIH